MLPHRTRSPALLLAALTLSLATATACSAGETADDASSVREAAAPEAAPTTTPTPTPTPSAAPPSATVPQSVVKGARFTRIPPPTLEEIRARAEAEAAAANPLAGRPWGVYQGDADQSWPPYAASSGETRELLAKISLQPKAKWFGDWISDGDIASKVSDYITNSQAGDPDALVQMSVFRMVPWEHAACSRLPSAAEQASYKRWTDSFASAIGDTPTAIILQPDGPFALCVPGGSQLPSSLIAYSARVFSELPHTSVYIDAGAADWPAVGQGGVDQAVKFLLPAGIEYARGIALNSTHYSATSDEVVRGAEIVEALAARGITDKHVVVNTSSNGRPFTFGDYQGPDPDNAYVCGTNSAATCVTLGIPPTSEVADPRWGLSDEVGALATEYVDGYLWFGRPWLYRQNDPFDMGRALALARSTPY